MGNESSVSVSKDQLVEINSSRDPAPVASDFSSSNCSASLSDFPSLELILAQPLVIGKKRLRPIGAETDDEIFTAEFGADACFKRVCISL